MTAADVLSWSKRAACSGVDVNIFYPTIGQPTDEAKKYCQRCPVMVECRTRALQTREAYGVWGGLSPQERESGRWERSCRACGDPLPVTPNGGRAWYCRECAAQKRREVQKRYDQQRRQRAAS